MDAAELFEALAEAIREEAGELYRYGDSDNASVPSSDRPWMFRAACARSR